MTAVVGLMLGLLMGLLLGFPLARFPQPWGTWLPLGVSLFLGLGHARPDRGQAPGPAHRRARPSGSSGRRRPTARAATRSGDPHIVVDTSAIIDGRIAEIVESGFIYGTLVVPALRARGAPAHRRQLGHPAAQPRPARPGDPQPDAEGAGARRSRSSRTTFPTIPEVDAKLVALARTRSRVILTNDFNLNRVAELQGVRVMNINSLANAVKPAVLPGEELRVRVIQEGKEAGQGVGFLDDGTMIVVEGGARHIDKDLDVAVTRVLQTVAGRMIFAQPRLD